MRSRLFLLFIFALSSVLCSSHSNYSDDEREFVPLSASSTTANAQDTSLLDDLLQDESVSISLSCEKTLGSPEESLKSFVMKSLDFTAEETFVDLERPTCRALFDRNGHLLSKEQLAQLMSTERGYAILSEGEVLEFFSDFSDFTLQDFDRFPSLQVGNIRNLSSIPTDILLTLVKQRGYTKAGRLERIPEAFGERVFEQESWKFDPEIWQLFTLEGLAQVHSIASVEKFTKFFADKSKFEKLIFTIDEDEFSLLTSLTAASLDTQSSRRMRSSTISSDISIRSTAPTSSTSTPLCRSIAKHSNLLSRWAVQCEELLLYLVELPEIARASSNHLPTIQAAVKGLIKTRSWLKEQLRDRCSGAVGISDAELLRLTNLNTILINPMAWRLREALKLRIENAQLPVTPMTRTLHGRLENFPHVIDFYRPSFRAHLLQNNDQLLTHFFLVNEISDLETIFEGETDTLTAANEKLVLSVALRRVLLLLLSPSLDTSNVIQDALNYVFSARSPLLATSDSNEIVRWFRQARDLQAVPVLDRLIRSFGHEFDVGREIRSILNNQPMRMKLFTEAQSAFVRLLVALASGGGLSELLIEETPKILTLPYLDPANALLRIQVPALPVHPGRRAHTQEEIDEHARQVEQVREHNAAISNTLQTSLRFLKTFSVDPQTSQLSVNFAGFVQPNFRIQFDDNVGVDAGGLRRTWLSALLRIFGDSQRLLFPMHLDDGGRTPAALLDPEIMGHLGALHGKALQIGVKPDWFFTRRYTHSVLFANHDQIDPEELAHIVEELYPEIFGGLDLIIQIDGGEAAAVEYFNASEFPTIAGLTEAETVEDESDSTVDESDGTVDETDRTTEMQAPIESPPHLTIQLTDDDSIMVDHHNSADSSTAQIADTPNSVPNLNLNRPPRHSFSRMLVFDVRYLAQTSIYNGPRQVVQSIQEIADYRTALLALLADNLLHGSQAYWRSFGIFFDSAFRDRLEAEFLHDLLEPPQVTIQDILTRVHFDRSCDAIFLIDDELEGEEVEQCEGEECKIDNHPHIPDLHSTSNTRISRTHVKRARSVPARLSNISARIAFTRILSDSFTSPESIHSLLSFSTGCPQIPPAGLDALRLSVNCYIAHTPASKLSKSHTCSNAIDFYASMHYKETRDAFIESAVSSSGFGFA